MEMYAKFIVAAVGAVVGFAVAFFQQNFGLDLSGSEQALVQGVIALLTAAGVYRVPNA